METELQMIFALCRDPMLAVTGGKISAMNAAARRLFPACNEGDRAAAILPDHLLADPAETFLSSMEVDLRDYVVSARRSGETLLLSFAAAQEDARGFLSDSLMNGMLSALFNIQLSAERLRPCLDMQKGDGEKYLSTLLHNYHLLNHKLSNLNLLYQIRESKLLLVPRHADLVTLCRDLADSVNLLTPPELPRVEFSSAMESLSAVVDAPKVERVLVNLLSNALKYTPAEGFVRLHLARSGSSAVLSVDDNGCGIAPEVLGTVFTAYEQRLSSRDLTSAGTGGLGLGICRAIVEQHGGALILESREGEGTTVRVLLPLTPPCGELLESGVPVYQSGGMDFLRTELSDILDWQSYGEKYLD